MQDTFKPYLKAIQMIEKKRHLGTTYPTRLRIGVGANEQNKHNDWPITTATDRLPKKLNQIT